MFRSPRQYSHLQVSNETGELTVSQNERALIEKRRLQETCDGLEFLHCNILHIDGRAERRRSSVRSALSGRATGVARDRKHLPKSCTQSLSRMRWSRRYPSWAREYAMPEPEIIRASRTNEARAHTGRGRCRSLGWTDRRTCPPTRSG